MMATVCWFSAGVSSAVAAALSPGCELVRIHIDDEHPDNARFAEEVAERLGAELTVLRSPYGSVANVARSQRYINGPAGAPCTRLLKRRVRELWERENPGQHVYVWGFDSDEAHRLRRMRDKEPCHIHEAPLVSRGIDKNQAHGLFGRLFPSLSRPAMYGLGYRNNNCIGCVKGGKGYWNRIRQDFPGVFAARAALEREIGASCIRGVYLDELDPTAGRFDEIEPSCGLACLGVAAEEGK